MDRKSCIEAMVIKWLELENASITELQKIEKELYTMEPFTEEDYFIHCHERFKNILRCPIQEKTLKRITVLLERKFKQFFRPLANSLMNDLGDMIHLWLNDDVNVCQNQVHLAIRIMLQIIQYLWNENSLKEVNIYRVEITLFALIKNNECTLECAMLAGTCLIRLIFAKCLFLPNRISFLIEFITTNNTSDLILLVFLTGLVNSGNNSVLTYKVEDIPLLLFIFPLILELCEKNINYIFQSFQLLLIWLGAMKKNLRHLHIENGSEYNFRIRNSESILIQNLLGWWKKDFEPKFGKEYNENEYFFQGSSRVFNHVFNLLIVNWENFIRGVPDLVKDCFSKLIELHLIEVELKSAKSNLIEELIQYFLQMTWTSKAKYPPLGILISHYGVEKLLNYDSSIPSNLIQTLKSNPMASSGADFYRIILKTLRQEQQDINVLIPSWQRMWMEPFFIVISSDNCYLQQNLFRHWFPPTLAVIPEVYDVLIKEFSKNFNQEGFQLATITLMSQARQSGILNLENLNDTNFIHESLFHLNENIRMQAFTFLCSTKRKAEALSSIEMKLIKEFLVYNLNIDNAPFRQQLVTQMKNVLVRLRDSCVSWISEERKKGIKHSHLNKALKFVDNIFWTVVQNLIPGARYQRRQTCLDLLSMMLDTLIAVPDVSKRKGGVPVKTPLLIAHAQNSNLWQFTCNEVFLSLLICTQDFMSEVKYLALNILQKYFSDSESLKNKENVDKLLDQGYRWLNSPKPHICESGSLLVNYILQCKLRENDVIALHNLDQLIEKLKYQFNIAKDNILLAAKSFPIHGIILALKTYINENEWANQSLDRDQLSKIIHELIDLISNIVKFILSILSSQSDLNCQAPSFEDIGLAIENILDAEGLDMDNDNPSMSVEHQLILSFCWLTLKECSFLISKLVIKMPRTFTTRNGVLSCELVKRMSDELVTILIGCRHRGAIEACSLAMGELCQSLTSEQFPEFRDIPKSILNSALEVIQTPNQSTSVTRRSAGLPLLFIAIISNESTQRKRFLLESCIANLIKISSASLIISECDVMDLPQTHAIHIIRALVHDSTLSQAILSHMTNVIKLCIDSFASPMWAIRNAALQLFGSLIPRLLGQKKVRDENSQHNTITAEVLFHRYPDFKMYLIQYLERLNSRSDPTEPGLVPILSLLSKLSTSAEGVNIVDDFGLLLDTFIGSPFYIIRKLMSNTFIATSNKSQKEILNLMIAKLNNPSVYQTGVNYIHGICLIVLQLLESNDFSRDQLNSLQLVLTNCYFVVAKQFSCYFVEALILNILNKISDGKPDLSLAILEVNENSTHDHAWKPGFNEWIKEITLIKLKTAKKTEVLQLTKRFLCQNNQDEILCCLNYIKFEIMKGLTSEMNLFFQEQILNLLCNNPHGYHIEESLTTLQNLIENEFSGLLHPHINSQCFTSFMKCAMNGNFGTSSAASSIVFVGYYLSIIVQIDDFILNCETNDLLNIWCDQIHNYSDPRKTEDLRLNSAEALKSFGATIIGRLEITSDNNNANLFLSLFHSGIALLIDENCEVRQKAAEFASLLPRPDNFYKFVKVNPNYALEIFCNYFASKFEQNIEFLNALWMKMSNDSSVKIDEFLKEERLCILFEQDDVNIYAEQFVLTKICSSIFVILLSSENSTTTNLWILEKLKCVLSDAENMAKFLADSVPGFGSVSQFSRFKPIELIYLVLAQIKVLLSNSFINSEDKNNLETVKLQLESICLPYWIE